MLDREEVAARLAAAVLQMMPEPPGQRPGQAPDLIAVCPHAVALYETILGMLPEPPPNKLADLVQPEPTGRRAAPAQRGPNTPSAAAAPPRR
jgi:hypothetical protein